MTVELAFSKSVLQMQVDMAVASLLEPEMSVKRLLLLLELAREGLQDGQAIPMPQWQQILRDFAM